jgi:hypothetical protein
VAARPKNALVADTPDIRHAARRLRWFSASFTRQVELLSEDSKVAYAIDQKKLARVFVAWLRTFEAHRRFADLDRRDFTHFVAGAMLRELIRENPLKATAVPVGADASNPAYYWPEGYAYVAYCLNVVDAVLEQEFDARLAPAPELDDIGFWWSFRENTRADPGWAIAFLDKFSGQEPSWDAPDLFFGRRRAKAALGADPAKPALG